MSVLAWIAVVWVTLDIVLIAIWCLAIKIARKGK